MQLGQAGEEEFGERADVGGTIAQRGHGDGNDVEAVIQVFAEGAAGEGVLQVNAS